MGRLLCLFVFAFFVTDQISPSEANFLNVISKCVAKLKEIENELEPDITGGCGCAKYSCGCCEHIEVEYLHLDETGCLNFTYLPEEIGIYVQFSFDGKVIFHGKASARNPPPLCFGLPHIIGYGACIKFYNLSLASHSFSGCAKLLVKAIVHETFNLGCFKINLPIPWNSHRVTEMKPSKHLNNRLTDIVYMERKPMEKIKEMTVQLINNIKGKFRSFFRIFT